MARTLSLIAPVRVRLPDGARIGQPEHADFLYVFDFGDGWHHLCTVGEHRIDPLDELGIVPAKPLPYWRRGELPDQYGRRWADDDNESLLPADPRRTDLPRFFPWWGPGADRYPG